MPIGITTDVLITCLGAVLGVVPGTRLPDSLKKALNNTLGIAAIAMGIVLILKVKNLSAVVLTLVIGSILGALFLGSGAVQSFITPDIIADFSATGGIITLCAGLSLAGIKKDLKVLNLLPALILIFLISSAWTALMG